MKKRENIKNKDEFWTTYNDLIKSREFDLIAYDDWKFVTEQVPSITETILSLPASQEVEMGSKDKISMLKHLWSRTSDSIKNWSYIMRPTVFQIETEEDIVDFPCDEDVESLNGTTADFTWVDISEGKYVDINGDLLTIYEDVKDTEFEIFKDFESLRKVQESILSAISKLKNWDEFIVGYKGGDSTSNTITGDRKPTKPYIKEKFRDSFFEDSKHLFRPEEQYRNFLEGKRVEKYIGFDGESAAKFGAIIRDLIQFGIINLNDMSKEGFAEYITNIFLFKKDGKYIHRERSYLKKFVVNDTGIRSASSPIDISAYKQVITENIKPGR